MTWCTSRQHSSEMQRMLTKRSFPVQLYICIIYVSYIYNNIIEYKNKCVYVYIYVYIYIFDDVDADCTQFLRIPWAWQDQEGGSRGLCPCYYEPVPLCDVLLMLNSNQLAVHYCRAIAEGFSHFSHWRFVKIALVATLHKPPLIESCLGRSRRSGEMMRNA